MLSRATAPTKSYFQKPYSGTKCLRIAWIRFQRLAKHVMQVHLNAAQTTQAQEGELSLTFLKKYISYCRKYVNIQVPSVLVYRPSTDHILATFTDQIPTDQFVHYYPNNWSDPRLICECINLVSSIYHNIMCVIVLAANVGLGCHRLQLRSWRTATCWWGVEHVTTRGILIRGLTSL